MNKFQPITGQKTIKSFKFVISLVEKSVECQNFVIPVYLNSKELIPKASANPIQLTRIFSHWLKGFTLKYSLRKLHYVLEIVLLSIPLPKWELHMPSS